MNKETHGNDSRPRLIVVEGPDKGREIVVPVGVLSLGRSSDNDISLLDPVLSRHNSQLAYDGSKLTIKDLDSANGTLVNGNEIIETKLHVGDIIEIGDTHIRVTEVPGESKAEDPAPSAPRAPESTAPRPETNPSIVVDLGFDAPDDTAPRATAKKNNLRPLLWGIGAVAVLLIASSLIMRAPEKPSAGAVPEPLAPPSLVPLEIEYEKIEASTSSVFRYSMKLDDAGRISVEIDDLSENRHVRKEGQIGTNRVAKLAKEINQAGFFTLEDSYEGIAPEGIFTSYDITVLSNRRAKRVTVANRVEPEIFQDIRKTLETISKNELGIWAIQFSCDKLVKMSEEALTRARNAYDQKGIAYGNTYEAIRCFKEASFYLETIDPKPDFFQEIVSGLAKAEEELDANYEQHRFLADRAINLRDWATAISQLQIIREMIPNEDDPRNLEAYRKLLDAQSRLKKEQQL